VAGRTGALTEHIGYTHESSAVERRE
jgi:hypothetical protein